MNPDGDAAERTLTLFDCSGIQAYLFQSNRLAESLGASELVRAALEDWLPESVGAICAPLDWGAWRTAPDHFAFGDSVVPDAEPIFVGGGNAAVLFRTLDLARRITTDWSERLLLEAPGLRGVVAHAPCPDGGLAAALRAAQADLAAFKRAHRARGLPLRWPVSRACSSTGLAANVEAFEPDGLPAFLARTAYTKREARYAAADRLLQRFPQVRAADYHFTDQMDLLGGREGESHVAVVHIDGNGMGRRLQNVVSNAITQRERDSIAALALRSVSLAAGRAVQEAMTDTIDRLLAALPGLVDRGFTPSVDPGPSHWPLLPLRPIVEGGDDVTFVCDGRLGLTLAGAFLQSFSDRPDAVGGRLAACAGVAIVPAHFPFRRAYDLAEELVRSAKTHARKWNEERKQIEEIEASESSWLDFDLSFGGALIPPGQRRAAADVRVGYPSVHRPWRVWPQEGYGEPWSGFAKIVTNFQDATLWPRSRVKALRDALASGREEINTLKAQFDSRGFGDRFPTTEQLRYPLTLDEHYGVYTDAVEALDFFLPV